MTDLINDRINCLVEQWHWSANLDDGGEYLSLPEFLDMSNEQYERWSAGLMSGQELQEWADSQQEKDDVEGSPA